MVIETTTLKILANRAGSVTEITNYLQDLEIAYNSLYAFHKFIDIYSERRKSLFPFDSGAYLSYNLKLDNSIENIVPEDRLLITKISIQSPGFWEVLGSLNPIQQLREFLKDRHERRKDIEWREQTEREKGVLENQLIQRQINESENRTVRERIEIFRELGFSNEEIRDIIWTNLSKPLIELGKHQDTGLINGAE
jgi:DNA-binding transcriptional MerR regulator